LQLTAGYLGIVMRRSLHQLQRRPGQGQMRSFKRLAFMAFLSEIELRSSRRTSPFAICLKLRMVALTSSYRRF
jgi:hypothetical protein